MFLLLVMLMVMTLARSGLTNLPAADVNGESVQLNHVEIDGNLGVQGDANFYGAVGVSGGLWVSSDVNVQANVDVSQDLNVGRDINVGGNVEIDGVFFGDGSGLTNVSATSDVNGQDVRLNNVEIDANLGVQGDANFYSSLGVSSGVWLGADLNVVGFTRTRDLNVLEDLNAVTVSATDVFATNFYGDGSTLSNIVSTSDVNDHFHSVIDLNQHYYQIYDVNAFFVPYVGAVADVNIGTGVRLRDLNVLGDINVGHAGVGSVTAPYFFGDGSGLENVSATSDINGEDISPQSVDIDANLGVQGDANFYGPVGFSSVVTGLNALTDSNFVNIGMSGGFASLTTVGDANFVNVGVSGGAWLFGDLNVFGVVKGRDVNVLGDVNVGHAGVGSISAPFFFGDGSGLENVSATGDVNGDDISPQSVDVDNNLSVRGDANFINVGVSKEAWIDGNIVFTQATQNWSTVHRAERLGFQAMTSGQAAITEVYSKDGDGTDLVGTVWFGEGNPADIDDGSWLLAATSTAVGAVIVSNAAGSGTINTLSLWTGTNVGQLVLHTDNVVSVDRDFNLGEDIE